MQHVPPNADLFRGGWPGPKHQSPKTLTTILTTQFVGAVRRLAARWLGQVYNESRKEPDWRTKKDEWIRSVERLYAQIREMLRDSIAFGDVSARTFNIEATGDLVGPYPVPVLELTIGGEHVELRPKGFTVIGVSGRVDLLGELDTVSLLRDYESQGPEWSVLVQRTPGLTIVELDQESFKYALERVMRPLP